MTKVETTSVLKILEDRGAKYGDYTDVARTIQQLKYILHSSSGWETMPATHRESLEMIVHKIGRLLNGDPSHKDSWDDIIGYAQLVVDRLGAKPIVRGVVDRRITSHGVSTGRTKAAEGNGNNKPV